MIENIKRANQDGALIANHVKAEGFLFDESGKITGVVARDLLTDQVFEIKARLVINTTGPWSDKVRNLSNKGTQFSQCVQLRSSLGSGFKQNQGFTASLL